MKTRSRMGVPAIAESLLKRKWSRSILRLLSTGKGSLLDVSKAAPELSFKLINDRFRTLLRYELIVRCARRASDAIVEYRLTQLGAAMLEVLEAIEELDRECRGEGFREETGESASEHGEGVTKKLVRFSVGRCRSSSAEEMDTGEAKAPTSSQLRGRQTEVVGLREQVKCDVTVTTM